MLLFILIFFAVSFWLLLPKSEEDSWADEVEQFSNGISWVYMVIYTLLSAFIVWAIVYDEYLQPTGNFVIYQMCNGYDSVEYHRSHSYFGIYLKYLFDSGALIITVLQMLEFVYALACWVGVIWVRIRRKSALWPAKLKRMLCVACIVLTCLLLLSLLEETVMGYGTEVWKREYPNEVWRYISTAVHDLAWSAVPVFFTVLMTAAVDVLTRRTAVSH